MTDYKKEYERLKELIKAFEPFFEYLCNECSRNFDCDGDCTAWRLRMEVKNDGNKLLETKVKAYSAFKSGSKVYNGNYLRNIKFLKNICIFSESYVDMLQINFYEDCMTIKDLANSIEYNVPKVDGQFPPSWKNLFPTIKEDGEYTTIGVNIQFIKELSKLSFNQRTGIVELSIKNNSPLSAILAKAKNPDGDISNRVLIMPIQIRH